MFKFPKWRPIHHLYFSVFLRPSFSQAHLYHTHHAYMGCPRQFWHSCQTCFTANIKVFSIATQSTVTSLITMLCLLWRKGSIHQLKSLGAKKKKNSEVPRGFEMDSYLVDAIRISSAKTNTPRPTPFSLCGFRFYSGCFSCTMTSDYLKRCLQTCHCRCFVNMWNMQDSSAWRIKFMTW